MTKADIVNEITKSTGIDKQSVAATLEAFMETVKESLSNEENVYLRGFGSCEEKGSENRSKHFEKYYYYNSGTQYSGI